MKVKFLPSGEEHEIEFNETILHLAQRKDLHIQSVCKGLPSCAECKVQIKEGEHHVLPPSSKEVALIGTAHYVDMSRLSCQLRCFGDVTVDLAEQVEKQERMKLKAKERGRSDGKESQAVLGSIVEEAGDFDEELDKASKDNRGRQRRKKHKKLDNKNAFYGGFLAGSEDEAGSRPSRNKKKKSRNKNQGGGDGSKKKSSKSSRRRRRKPTNKSKAPS